MRNTKEALDLVLEAIEAAGFNAGTDILIAPMQPRLNFINLEGII